MSCYDYKLETEFSKSNGIVLADTPLKALSVIRNMPEYKGLRNMTITIYGDKCHVYSIVDGKRQTDKSSRLEWQYIDPTEAGWDTRKSYVDDGMEARCIGHLRGDFGRSGEEFWTSWFDHHAERKTGAFRAEFQDIVNGERKRGHLLHDYKSMLVRGCGQAKLADGSYLLTASTAHYEYIIRCIPRRNDYNFYLYCYDKQAE